MRYGTVVQFFPGKGFGFIRPDQGDDVFFHITAIGGCEEKPEIEIGQAVKYELLTRSEQAKLSPSGTQPAQRRAKLVELIARIPGGTLAEVGEKQSPRHPRARRKKPTWRG